MGLFATDPNVDKRREIAYSLLEKDENRYYYENTIYVTFDVDAQLYFDKETEICYQFSTLYMDQELKQYISHYLCGTEDEDMGEYTKFDKSALKHFKSLTDYPNESIDQSLGEQNEKTRIAELHQR